MNGERRSRRWSKGFEGYLFLAPALLLLLAFNLIPMLYNLFISLHEWGIRPGEYIGLQNYQTLFADKQFWSALGITISYVLLVVPAEIILAMVIAVLLFQNVRGKALYRLIYFLPFITSMVAIAIVWGWIFNANFGLVNSLYKLLGIPEQRWLLEPRGFMTGFWDTLGVEATSFMKGPSQALLVISLVTIWYYLGFHIVTFLAGLTSIPSELKEAAVLDGAGSWQVFRYIIIPLLSPIIYMLTVIATIGSFQAFVLVFVMTGGGYGSTGSSGDPLGTTRLISLFIFDNFYRFFKVGYGAAAAMVLFVVILVMTVIQRRIIGKRVYYMGG